MYLKTITEQLFLITLLLTPLYLVRFEIFSIPTNLLEMLALVSIFFFFLYKKGRALLDYKKTSHGFRTLLVLLLFGLFLSLFYKNNFSWHGLGILKGWFIIPILFSLSASSLFKKEFGIKKALFYIYLSFILVSIASIFFKAFGVLTFDGRLSSLYQSPNNLSMFLVFGLYIFPYLFFSEKIKVNRALLTISLIPILFSIYWTFSYSVWLSVGFSFLILFVLYKDFSKKSLYLLFIFLVFLIFFIFQYQSPKISSILDSRSSLSSRTIIWQSSFKLIEDNMFFGIGPGNFQDKYLEYQKYFPPYLEWAVPHPHNVYLAFWLQAGFIGFLAFIFILLKIIFLLAKKEKTYLSMVFLGLFLYILIHGFFDTPLLKNDLSYLFWIALFLSLNYINLKNQSDK